jgi:hypothetical protein
LVAYNSRGAVAAQAHAIVDHLHTATWSTWAGRAVWTEGEQHVRLNISDEPGDDRLTASSSAISSQ